MDGSRAQGVKHGGDPDRCQLRIMGDECRQMRPVDFRSRFHMAFEVVGVQLDQTGNYEIPGTIHATAWFVITFDNFGYHAFLNDYASCQNFIRQDKTRIGEAKVF